MLEDYKNLEFPEQFVKVCLVCRQIFFVSCDTLCGAASGLVKVVMPVSATCNDAATTNT